VAITTPASHTIAPCFQKKAKLEGKEWAPKGKELPGGIQQREDNHGSKDPMFRKGNGMPAKMGRGKKGETPEQTWAREKKKISLGMAEVAGGMKSMGWTQHCSKDEVNQMRSGFD